ncbi:MAG: CAP domain-containing protein [Oscillospiraceae bacterium]|jgi:uncharacterized protein YkwD|nr:CAP domain-containing protein [Oscillospiraceae bacterium]
MKKRIVSLVLCAVLLTAALVLPASAATNTTGFAAEVLRLVNVERAAAGLPAVAGTIATLHSAAQKRAKEASVVWSHTRPNGSDCFTVLEEVGLVQMTHYIACGENLAYGQASPAQVVKGWMLSADHRKNILGDYTHLGVGVFEKNDTLYWAQMFIKEPPTSTGGRANTGENPGTDANAGAAEPNAPFWASWPPIAQWALKWLLLGWLWQRWA